ncbi:MAG: hypothetical protein Phyf2KO_15910 [Phycisphaerales bacterium]
MRMNLCFVLVSGLSAASEAQQVLPIVNPSFEQVSRPLASGEITNGSGGVGVPVGTRPNIYSDPQFDDLVTVPGWRTRLPPKNNPTARMWAGILHSHEASPGQDFLTGVDGANVAALHHLGMQQTLPVFIEPNTTYRLSFLSGYGFGMSPDGIHIALLAAPDLETPVYFGESGQVVLVAAQGLHPPFDSEGELLPYEIEVTTPEVLPAEFQSQYIAIGFIGSDGIPQMCYDDFVLTAESLDCIADVNGDGALTPADFTAWVNAFNNNLPECDQNSDGSCTPTDFTAWIANYTTACE